MKLENKNYKLTLFTLILIAFSTYAFVLPASKKVGKRLNSEKIDFEYNHNAENNYLFSNPDSLNGLDNPDSLLADSLKIAQEEIDSAKIDSTYRLKNFKYVRSDNRFLSITPKRKIGFYAYPSETYKRRTVELDSTGSYVIIKEFIGDSQVRPELKLPLDEYIKLRLASTKRKSWEDMGYQYELMENKDDLGQLFSDITNIEIPLPKVGILSIFGPPKINLKINGAVDIHGAWRNETTAGVTASLLGNTRNEPDFKQQVQINVNGLIGDKLTIAADWNTERTFEYENQLKLQYKGYDDEIIQSVEAGNVSLQTSPLVGGGEALFGIKALFQFGPFSLTALASQKKSQAEEVSVTGGTQKNKFELHAYDYSPNHFFLDTVYASTKPQYNFFEKYYANATPNIDNTFKQYYVKDIEVWKSTSQKINIGDERKANAYIDLEGRDWDGNGSIQPYGDDKRTIGIDQTPGRNVIDGRFVKLEEGTDYEINRYVGVISFKSQLNTEDAIAVAYRIEGDPGSNDKYFGELLSEVGNDTSKVMVLKLVKPEKLKPGGDFADAWKLQLKNIYPIGGRNINKENFTFDINYEISGQEPVREIAGKNILQAFGLDKTDESGTGGPDGAFDWDPGRTIIQSTGEIIFPTLQPFGKDFPFDDKSLAYQAVYDTTSTIARNDNTKDKFLLVGEYSAESSSVYSIGFNVVENSVKVYLDGRLLENGQDYSVDYNIGQVVIRNADALVPGANLKISYEKNDLFQLASKTLIGLRGIYDVSKKTKVGFSFLNLNQTTLSDKVRIGEEPLSNSIYGVDFQTSMDLPFLTKGLDNLISTKEMSSLAVKGEVAYMNPDPNTKKSSISSDNSQSIAYIDDFEGAKRIIPIGISYTGWRDISVPDRLNGISQLSKLAQTDYKAKSYWYNVLPTDVTIPQIWGNKKQYTRNQGDVQVLDFVYNPTKRGSYNYHPNLSDKSLLWGGMMHPVSSSASNLDEENIEFIEFWMQVDQAPKDGKIIIDLGQISEDIIPNNEFDTEDKKPYNDILDEGEDVGLDGLTNAQEIAKYGDVDGTGDPSGDDFQFTLGSSDYSHINGTQGNGTLSDLGRIPDSEDMVNKNYGVDKVNSYFRYEIPLDTNKAVNKFISGGGDTKYHWFQFRIPLREPTDKINNPTLTLVEAIRLWVAGADSTVHVRLAEMNLVGNQWQKVVKQGANENDTTLVISTVNIEDNSPEYYSPPGVTRERDRTSTETVVYKNEQSLQLKINNLQDGDHREIVKYLYRPLDVFNYKEMKLFIHGDMNDMPGSISYYNNSEDYGSEVYFRFGTDTSNYYEYRQPVRSDWQEISILFSKLTAIKQSRPDPTVYYSSAVEGEEGHFYGIKGNPTLTKVNYFSFGIKNPSQKSSGRDDRVSGTLWVNELRVLGAEDTPGLAYSGSAQLKIADLLNVSFNAGQTDPYFHKLSDRFGTRVDSRNWNGSVNLDVIKLLPWNLTGSSFNVNYARSESISKPLYKPGTDVSIAEAVQTKKESLVKQGVSDSEASKIAEEDRTSSQTLNVSDTWSISSIRFKLPSKSWYIEDIINNLQFAFNYNKTYSRNPQMIFTKGWQWSGSGKYSLNFSNDNYLFLADIPVFGSFLELFTDYKNAKFYFTPQTFTSGISASRRSSSSLSRQDSAQINTQRDFTAKRNLGFNWKLTEGGLINISLAYNVDVASSYAHLLTINDMDRPESAIWGDILHGQLFGKDYSYSQNVNVKANPQLPSIWDINKYIDLNFGISNSYNWTNNFKQDSLGRSAGYSNSLRAGLSIKLKSLTSSWFEEKAQENSNNNRSFGRRQSSGVRRPANIRNPEKDTVDTVIQGGESLTDSTAESPREPIYSMAFRYLKLASKWLFFDYENINFDFSNSVTASRNGILAEGTGFTNFWGLQSIDKNGPSRSFMLGLSQDVGARAPNGNLADNYSEKNSLTFKTSRPLWEGATINLDWDVGWGFNKSTRITTDADGNVTINDVTSSGSMDKSFMYLPIFFSKAGIKEVYDIYHNDPNKDIAAAFENGFESLPILANIPVLKDVSKYIPRANWRINWRGLEKFEFLKGIARSISLDHAYTSGYSEGWRTDPDGKKQIQTQKVNYGFAPLLGMNITFDNLWNGNLTGSVKYSAKTSFDLGITTKNVTESFTKDINVTASFSKSGFSLPFFGLNLKNDIEMSLSYTSAQNSVLIYEMDTENFNDKGKPQDGTTRTIIEPRIKYTVSSKVTLAVFYKRTSVQPEGASRIPATTTNEAGLDVHISIQ